MTRGQPSARKSPTAKDVVGDRHGTWIRCSDDGSAVVDFVLVTLVLVPLFVAIVQVGLALYVRNALAACAQDGARYGSDADIVGQGAGAVSAAAVGATTSCIDQSLSSRFARNVTGGAQGQPDGGGGQLDVVEVHVASPVPVIGFFGVGTALLHVQGDAMQERQ